MNAGICILAGGSSERMGREKARMRLGPRTLLGHVRHTAQTLGVPVRIIQKDLVPRCGPLGGIYTGLKTSRHEAELFLSCDMPFVTTKLIKRMMALDHPLFVEHQGTVGFPFMLAATDMDMVEKQMRLGRLSLQNLAESLKAKRLRLRGAEARQLFNVNTPEDWQEALQRQAELPL